VKGAGIATNAHVDPPSALQASSSVNFPVTKTATHTLADGHAMEMTDKTPVGRVPSVHVLPESLVVYASPLTATQSVDDAHDTSPRSPGSDAGAPAVQAWPPSVETTVVPEPTPMQVSEPGAQDTDSKSETPAGTLSALQTVPPSVVDRIWGAMPVVSPNAVHKVVDTQEIDTSEPTEAGTDCAAQLVPAVLVA
jgi:hypothetical protein